MPRRPRKCTLEHVVPPPRLADYEGSRHIISAKTLDHIIYTQLRDRGLLTSNYKYFRGDSNMRSCDVDLIFDIIQWGNAIKQQRSAEVTVPAEMAYQLQPGSITRTNEDGSVVAPGQTGQCDNQSVLAHADMCLYADLNREAMGWDFASGFLWQYAPRGHSPNWLVDNDLRFHIFQVGRPRETFLIDPAEVPGLQIHMIYEA